MTRHPSFITAKRVIVVYTSQYGLAYYCWSVVRNFSRIAYCQARHITLAQRSDVHKVLAAAQRALIHVLDGSHD